MNAKNTMKLSAAMGLVLSLAALSSNAAEAPRVGYTVDLPAITVRPDAALRAELAAIRVVDLPAVTVRPDAALRTELAARTFVARVVDLPTVHVHPSAEQVAERAAIVAAEQARALAAQLADTLVAEVAAVASAR